MNLTSPNRSTERLAINSERPDILYVVHRVPYPPDKGDRIRSFHLLKSLASKAAVHLACLADEPLDPSAVTALRQYCEQVEIIRHDSPTRWIRALHSLACGRTVSEGAFSSPGLRAILRHWSGQIRFQAALASASSMVPYLRMNELRDVPAVVDLVDVDSQKWLDYAAASRGPKAWLYRTEGHRLRRIESELPDWTRAVTLVSEAEVDLYRQFRLDEDVHAVTVGVDLDVLRPQPRVEESGCVFVGALDYPPNVNAARWFCHEVWPAIHHRYPQATMSLVGRQPTKAVRRLAALSGVELVGQVPDVRPYLARAAVAVAPLQIARGVQTKILEALAMAKAVVASPQALTGLRIEVGVHALAATSPGDWVDAISTLLNDQDLRQRLGEAGRRYVEDHHQWDICLDPLATLLGLMDGPFATQATKDVIAAAGAGQC